MLPPAYLEALPENILKLYREAELAILEDMARRLTKYDYWTPAAEHQKRVLQEAGRSYDEILSALSALSGKATEELRRMTQDAAACSLAIDEAAYKAAGMQTPVAAESERLTAILNAGYKAARRTLLNLTQTTARETSRQFTRALDSAWLSVSSGAMDVNTAVKNAVKELAEGGVKAVRYSGGRCDTLEVAVRRAVVTGVNQTALQLQEELAAEVGCDLVETTAHAGARPEHALWQGKIFSLSGNSSQYPSLREATGYGTGAGLGGWNCRHSFRPYLPGSPKAYTEETLQEFDAPKYEYNGEKLTEYEAAQAQRYNERQLRRWRREYAAMDAAGLDTAEAAAKVRYWQERQEDFLNGLKRQFEREGSTLHPKQFARNLLPDSKNTAIPMKKFTEGARNPQKNQDKPVAFQAASGYNINNTENGSNSSAQLGTALKSNEASRRKSSGKRKSTLELIANIKFQNGKYYTDKATIDEIGKIEARGEDFSLLHEKEKNSHPSTEKGVSRVVKYLDELGTKFVIHEVTDAEGYVLHRDIDGVRLPSGQFINKKH